METHSIGRRIVKLERAQAEKLAAEAEEARRCDPAIKAAVDRVEALMDEGRKPDGEDLGVTLAWITLAGTYEDRVRLNQLMQREREVDPGSDEYREIEEEIVQFASEVVERAP